MNEYKTLCLKKCDCGSECLELANHGNRHETQHGCIFYDTEDAPDRCTADSSPEHEAFERDVWDLLNE
jgi:hypothetical protein